MYEVKLGEIIFLKITDNLVPVGIMQGRLLPKYKGLYQSFPGDKWMDEFILLNNFNINFIELILDNNQINKNPLINSKGLERLASIMKDNKIMAQSICADIFIKYPFHSYDETVVKKSSEMLFYLIDISEVINLKNIIIPCVDESSLKNTEDETLLLKNLEKLVNHAERKKINICLETDLNPEKFRKLILRFNSDSIKINYDTGNSASLGYKIDEEFDAYGKFIKDIHIKDRTYNSGPVFLGQGDFNINSFFTNFKKFKIKPDIFVFQTYRDDEGVNIFKDQLEYFLEKFKKFGKIKY